MYRRDFDSFLQKKTPRATLLYGESDFFIQAYSNKIVHKIGVDASVSKFYYGEYEFGAVMSLLGQSSLFGDSTVVVLKISKKIDKKDLDSMLSALSSNPNNSLIIEFYRDENKSPSQYSQDFRSMAGAFKSDDVAEVRFFAPNLPESIFELRQRAKILNLEIDDRVLKYLLGVQNGDLAIAVNELEKFTLIQGSITNNDVDKLCYGIASSSIQELNEAILSKDKATLEIFFRLIEEGFDEIFIINEMERFFYQLFLFFAYIKTNGSINAKEILGFAPPQNIVEKTANNAIKLREEQYMRVFDVLGRWRLEIMSGKSKNSGSICALIEIQVIFS